MSESTDRAVAVELTERVHNAMFTIGHAEGVLAEGGTVDVPALLARLAATLGGRGGEHR
jgi:hypothetical protein